MTFDFKNLEDSLNQLSDDDVNKIEANFKLKDDPALKHNKHITNLMLNINREDLVNWFNQNVIVKLNNQLGNILLYTSEIYEDDDDNYTDVEEAYAKKLLYLFKNLWEANNWDLNHGFTSEIDSSTYTFDTMLYSFKYKGEPYVLEQMEGQGEILISIVKVNLWKSVLPKLPVYDPNDLQDYHEIGNYVEISDDFSELI